MSRRTALHICTVKMRLNRLLVARGGQEIQVSTTVPRRNFEVYIRASVLSSLVIVMIQTQCIVQLRGFNLNERSKIYIFRSYLNSCPFSFPLAHVLSST